MRALAIEWACVGRVVLGAAAIWASPGFAGPSSQAAESDSLQSVATQPTDEPPAGPAASSTSAPALQPGEGDVLEQVQSAFVRIVERVSPAVVGIRADDLVGAATSRPATAGPLYGSIGTGFFIRSDGMILTCEHVVRGATAILVTMHDGRRVRARQVATDPRCDLAVIQVAAGDVTAVAFGDARAVRAGHLVMAFGPAWTSESVVAPPLGFGIVTAAARALPEGLGSGQDRYYGEMIETTAGVGPGSSGGPLIDIRGRVIGVIGVRGEGPSEATAAYAIPMHEGTRRVVESLLQGRAVEYGYLGVEAADAMGAADPASGPSREAGLERHGAVLAAVYPGGPADRAGLRMGDVIVSLCGRSVGSANELVRRVGEAEGDREVEIAYRRDGELTQATARTLIRAAATADDRAEAVSWRGAVLAPMNDATRAAANLPRHALLVLRVEAHSPTGRAALSPGDVVVRIDGLAAASHSAARLAETDGDVLLGLASGASVVVRAGG